MSDPYETLEQQDSYEGIDYSSQGDHDSLYTNPQMQAKHLVQRYGTERAMEMMLESYDDTDDEEVRQWVNDAAGEVQKSEPSDLGSVIEATMDAVEKSTWWVKTEYRAGEELSKAPGIWRGDDRVPEYVREFIREVIDSTRWDWAQFESLDGESSRRLQEMLEEKLTQPQGWSIDSIAEDIEDEFDVDQETSVGLASDTTHNVLNTAREEAYDEMEGSEDFVYDWIGPSDHRTTKVCREIKEEIEDRGGSVSKPTLESILRSKAQKYEDTREGGTPGRVDMWEPHYQCRHVMVRRVQSI